MTAWSRDWSKAPKDRSILCRKDKDYPPASISWAEYEVNPGFTEWEGWEYDEELLRDVAGGPDADELDDSEWCEIPE